MKQISKEKSILILAHVVGWIFFISIPIIEDPGLLNFILKPPGIFILTHLLLIGYFYLNMNLLVPRFLSKRKVFIFIGITASIYLLLFVALPWIIHHFFMPEPPFNPHLPFSEKFREGFRGNENFRPRMRNPHDMMRKLGLYTRSTYFLIVFIVSTGLKVLSQWYEEKRRLSELENSTIQAELSSLKSQIHPHFLFNILNSIYYLSLSKDDKTPRVILSLSNFLRFVTTESDKNFIQLEKEIQMLREYLELQSLRTSEKIDLQTEITGDFDYRKIMPLIFIPFVENAFKYGVSAHIDCFIHLKIRLEKGILEFNIENSVIPGQKDLVQSAGVGLENIRKRLELAYPERHVLEIKNASGIFSVYLKIYL